MDIASLRFLEAQHGRCPKYRELLLDADRPPQSPREWEQWLTVTRKAVIRNAVVLRADGTPGEATARLLHAYCHQQYARSNKHLCPPASVVLRMRESPDVGDEPRRR
jgi:RNA-directed DNA polymerase